MGFNLKIYYHNLVMLGLIFIVTSLDLINLHLGTSLLDLCLNFANSRHVCNMAFGHFILPIPPE